MDNDTEIIIWIIIGILFAIILVRVLPRFIREMNEKQWDVTPDFFNKKNGKSHS